MDVVDIIMPAYNCEEVIQEAIESVKKQTYSKWKLIIINDGSTDETNRVILESTADIKEKVIILHTQENKGVAEARNLGLKEVTSDYIAFIDADDIWNETKLEKQIKFMKENKYFFTYTSFYYLKNGKKVKAKKIPEKLNYYKALKNTSILTSTVMINIKKIGKELLKMPNVGSEDTATWWKILKNNYTAYGMQEELTTYRIRNIGLSSKKSKTVRRTWKLYREVEKISLIKSFYYFMNYAINATIRRINIEERK